VKEDEEGVDDDDDESIIDVILIYKPGVSGIVQVKVNK